MRRAKSVETWCVLKFSNTHFAFYSRSISVKALFGVRVNPVECIVYNGSMTFQKKFFFVFLLAFSLLGMGVFPFVTHAEDSVDELEDKYAKTLKKLKEEEKEAALLNSKLTGINQNLSVTEKAIMATQAAINATRSDLERKILEIQLLEQQVAQREEYLTEMIRELYAYGDNVAVAYLFAGREDFDASFHAADGILPIGERLDGAVQDIRTDKENVENEKGKLETMEEEHERLLLEKSKQKQNLVLAKVDTQEDIEDQATIIKRLKKELSELQGDLATLTGKSYNAKDIREAVEFASKRTGVPQGVLYGFLKQETNLGANTGQCTYDDVERVSIAGYKKYGKKYKASIDRLYRRWDLFKEIVDDLGYSKNKKVSCTIAFAKAGPNQGGAMGVAQFMSDTWLGYEARIKSETGHSKPDPWNLTDGVMAMALKVKAAGGASNNAAAIKKATIAYYGVYSAGYYNNVLYWSKNYKSLFD